MRSKRNIIITSLLTLSILIFTSTVLKLSSYKKYLSYIKQPKCLTLDKFFDRKFIPNCTEIFHIEGRNIEYRINEMGLRERPFSELQQEQVVVIGDSAIEGMGLKFEETFGQVFEKVTQPHRKLQFINMGTRRTGPISQLLKLKHDFNLLNPKYIIWSITENDFDDDYLVHSLKAKAFDEEGLPIEFNKDFFADSDISQLSRVLLKIPSFESDLFSIFKHLAYSRDSAKFLLSWKDKPALCNGIHAAERFVQSKNVPLVFMVVPFGPNYISWPNEGDLKVKLNKLLSCIKSTQVFDLRISSIQNNPDLFQKDLMHFNSKGVEQSVAYLKDDLFSFLKIKKGNQ